MTQHRSWYKTVLGVFFTALMLFPVYWMVNVSFTPNDQLAKANPDWFPIHGTVSGYVTVLHQQGPYILTSLFVGICTVIVTLVVAAPAGYALGKLQPPGGGLVGFLLLVAQMIPGIIMAIGFYAIFTSLNILNNVFALVLADSTLSVPFAVLIFAAFMSGIPRELLQASEIDGAGSFRTFWSVVLPVSRNSIVTVALFTFLWSWSDFIFANTLDAGGDHLPITLGIYHYIGDNQLQWTSIMATAVIASIPATILLIVAQRYVAAGVTAGAIKD